MSSLRRRLERLEGGGDRPCPECGGPWQPGDPVPEYVIIWPGDPDPEPIPPCPRCGRERLIVVDWDDAPTPEELARMEARMFDHAREHPELHHLRPPTPDDPPNSWPDEGEG